MTFEVKHEFESCSFQRTVSLYEQIFILSIVRCQKFLKLFLQVTLVHHSNCLVMKASKDGKPYEYFDKSCLAFSEATIPSIAAPVMQLFLYLETAEVIIFDCFASWSSLLV